MANPKKPTVSFRAPSPAVAAFVDGGTSPLGSPVSVDAARPMRLAVEPAPAIEPLVPPNSLTPEGTPGLSPSAAPAPEQARSRPTENRARRVAAVTPVASTKPGGRRTLQRTDGRAVRQHSIYLEVSLSKRLAMRALEEERDVSAVAADALELYLQQR